MPSLSSGVIPIAPTPFEEDGSLGLRSIPPLVDYYERCGVAGLTILGVMGEADKLAPEETLACTAAFLDAARDKLQVIVGATSSSLAGSAALGRWAMERGAAGVMLQPMRGLGTEDDVVRYFEAFIAATDGTVPICVQDYPISSGVNLTVAAWTRLSHLAEVFMLKHEPPAGLQKLSAIRRAEERGAARRVTIMTSNNALHLPQELDRGADGAMVGVAYSDVIVQVCALHREGRREQAADLFDALLPLVRHECQGQFGLAIRKEILRRRGALHTAAVRYPGTQLQNEDLAELDMLIARFEARHDDLVRRGPLEPADPVQQPAQ